MGDAADYDCDQNIYPESIRLANEQEAEEKIPMRYNVFVPRINGDEECHSPVMKAGNKYRIGSLIERYPTGYAKHTLGAAVAYALENYDKVEVRKAVDINNPTHDYEH